MLVLGCLAAALAATGLVGGTGRRARMRNQDPTPSHARPMGLVLDPLRDFEDNSVSGGPKAVEDATKIHLGLGFTEAYTWDFNSPSGSLIALHSLEHHNDGVPVSGSSPHRAPARGGHRDSLWVYSLKLDAARSRAIQGGLERNGASSTATPSRPTTSTSRRRISRGRCPMSPLVPEGPHAEGGKFVTLLGAESSAVVELQLQSLIPL